MGKSQGDRQCTQCGAGLGRIPARNSLAECPFCGSRLYIEPGEVVDRWILRPVLQRSECHRLLSAWLWENYQGTASELEIGRGVWVPWLSQPAAKGSADKGRYRLIDGHDIAYLEEAGMPPGEYQPLEHGRTSGFELLESPPPAQGQEVVYVPCYTATFIYGGVRRSAAIEACTGRMAGYLPASRDRIWQRWGFMAGAGILFLVEALFIPGLVGKVVALGLTFFIMDIVTGLVWEGWGWRR